MIWVYFGWFLRVMMVWVGVVCEGELGIGYFFGFGESFDWVVYLKKGLW